ncbi:hypothetical protein [Dactylosporangium maewongense]|uniref:hypothetical protein n=1 Tax=Dactylosporangium maewongense TaxID=634393 RepID=UPI0031DA0178
MLLWLSALCEFGGGHAGVGMYILCEVLTGEKFFGNYWDDACIFTEIERRIGPPGNGPPPSKAGVRVWRSRDDQPRPGDHRHRRAAQPQLPAACRVGIGRELLHREEADRRRDRGVGLHPGVGTSDDGGAPPAQRVRHMGLPARVDRPVPGEGAPSLAVGTQLRHLDGSIGGRYSHVTTEMIARLLEGLTARWGGSPRRPPGDAPAFTGPRAGPVAPGE